MKKDIRTLLVDWIKKMGFETDQAHGILDRIITKILPVCQKLKMNQLKVLEKAAFQTNCSSVDMLKKNINFIFEKEIKSRLRKEIDNKYLEAINSGPTVSKETIEAFRKRLPLRAKSGTPNNNTTEISRSSINI